MYILIVKTNKNNGYLQVINNTILSNYNAITDVLKKKEVIFGINQELFLYI